MIDGAGRVANMDAEKFIPKKRELVRVHGNCYEVREEGGRPLATMSRDGEGEPWMVHLPRGEGYGIQELRSVVRHVTKVAKEG
jgi:hypothetical protein